MKVYFMQDGKPVEIKRSSELNIKLSKKEKEQLRQMRKHRNGTLTLELTDPYKEFKDKIKAQNGKCKITTKWNQANKETRILSRSPWVKEHCIFKDASLYTSEYRRAMEIMCSFSLKGKNKHDDVPDAFSDLADFAESLTIKPIKVGKRPF